MLWVSSGAPPGTEPETYTGLGETVSQEPWDLEDLWEPFPTLSLQVNSTPSGLVPLLQWGGN